MKALRFNKIFLIILIAVCFLCTWMFKWDSQNSADKSDEVVAASTLRRSDLDMVTTNHSLGMLPQLPRVEKGKTAIVPLTQKERDEKISEISKCFADWICKAEFKRASLIESKETAEESRVKYVVRKASLEENKEAEAKASELVSKSERELQSDLAISLKSIIKQREERYKGDAPYQLLQFLIPTDPRSFPTVIETGVQGIDAESLNKTNYVRMGQWIDDYPQFLKLETVNKN